MIRETRDSLSLLASKMLHLLIGQFHGHREPESLSANPEEVPFQPVINFTFHAFPPQNILRDQDRCALLFRLPDQPTFPARVRGVDFLLPLEFHFHFNAQMAR